MLFISEFYFYAVHTIILIFCCSYLNSIFSAVHFRNLFLCCSYHNYIFYADHIRILFYMLFMSEYHRSIFYVIRMLGVYIYMMPYQNISILTLFISEYQQSISLCGSFQNIRILFFMLFISEFNFFMLFIL